MPLAVLVNADLVTQPKYSIVRAGLAPLSCLLAQADDGSHVVGLLGTRDADVAPSAGGNIVGFADGMTVILDGSAVAGDAIYLSGTVAGAGTNVAPSIKVLLGIAYFVMNVGGTYYASLIQAGFIPQVPVPAPNSTANTFSSDVVGNKQDDENGDSVYSKGYRTDRHDHSAAQVYPTLAAGINVTKSATPWTLGAFAVLVPTGTITSPFDVHGINFDDVPANGVYEIVLYAGPNGSEVEVGRVRFTRTSANDVELESPFQSPIISANSQVKVKLAGSNATATVVTISIRYHVY